MKSIIIVFILTNLLYQHCFGYTEKRTFRERSKIHCRLRKQCKQYDEWDDNYREMMQLSDVPGSQPEGYLVRFPFYALAERDAHIVFSETENPDWFVDDVYEFVFAGWENKRATLRRKRQDQELVFQYTDEILTKNSPLKLLIEITSAGDIRAYVEHTLKPIIEFKDSNPLQIKYFGFSSLGQSLARYFYDCRGDEVYTKSQLQSQCQHVNTTSNEHTQFHRIPDNSITDTDQYSIEIPLYVAASHDAHILLASDNSFNSIRNGYEFVIGDDINRRVSIHKIGRQSTSTLADFRRADIFLPNEVLNLIVQISKSGKIELFSKHDHTQYKLLASVDDHSYDLSVNPLQYISFASFNSTPMDFYYDCSMAPTYIDTQLATKYAAVGHPLLLEDPTFQTPVDKRNWLTSRCKQYSNFKYEYKDFIKLSDIRDSKPNGYIVRLAFYAQGTRNAHVLLSRTATPNLAAEPVYEFIIGGWVNSRVLIRRKKSDVNPLQQVFVPPILSAQTPVKFIIEVANSGTVRIYAESDKIEPIASFFDPIVLPVNYVSFCGYDNLVRFYYDCSGQH
ncbi:uncharacterized protein LOC129573947 [Sitodiplosis mosellana]|uniref:uncharacterized protein LOC129573947 n=1 Tax=Sitodiplosis mosellana TaxID=263140 RepID=UPI002444C451|nr:uncharacterized protein LOC129573947 [Sitodiplosis mosellana]